MIVYNPTFTAAALMNYFPVNSLERIVKEVADIPAMPPTSKTADRSAETPGLK